LSLRFRVAAPPDLAAVVAMLEEYMRETYDVPFKAAPEALAGAAFGGPLTLHLVEAGGAPIGFAAWQWTFDLHHCVRGVEIIDLYVRRAHRGRAVAVALLAEVAAAARSDGATFMKGGAVAGGTGGALYRRFTVGFASTEHYLSGRAFRAFAEAAGAAPRGVGRGRPPRGWSKEP
jgi:GNAT superfamily N-acetyltransferase